jgi:hypothetical protein
VSRSAAVLGGCSGPHLGAPASIVKTASSINPRIAPAARDSKRQRSEHGALQPAGVLLHPKLRPDCTTSLKRRHDEGKTHTT